MTTTQGQGQGTKHTGSPSWVQQGENSGNPCPFTFQNPRRKLNSVAYLLIFLGAVCLADFNFLFDQLTKKQCEPYNYPGQSVIYLSWDFYIYSIVSLFSAQIIREEKPPPVPGELKLCSVVTAILAFFQPLYRSWPLLCHPQHLCQPSYLLSPPGFLYHRPDGAQSCAHTQNITIAVLKLTTASRIKNKLTSVGHQLATPAFF